MEGALVNRQIGSASIPSSRCKSFIAFAVINEKERDVVFGTAVRIPELIAKANAKKLDRGNGRH